MQRLPRLFVLGSRRGSFKREDALVNSWERALLQASSRGQITRAIPFLRALLSHSDLSRTSLPSPCTQNDRSSPMLTDQPDQPSLAPLTRLHSTHLQQRNARSFTAAASVLRHQACGSCIRPPGATVWGAPRGYSSDAGSSAAAPLGDVSGGGGGTEAGQGVLERASEWGSDAWGRLGEVWERIPPSVKEYVDWHHPMFQTVASESLVIAAFLAVWKRLPRILSNLHKYQEDMKAKLPNFDDPKSLERHFRQQPLLFKGPVPYELSVYHALEDPARLLIALFAFTHLGAVLAPTALGLQYLALAWKGGVVGSGVWFLYRWRGNFFARLLANKDLDPADRERYLAADKLSAVGLLAVGTIGVAETCGLAVQSLLTVGGIGGIATAFAARDVIGNFLSGVTLHLYRPFSIGDQIAAGSVEGKVTDIGFHSTHLLSSDKSPIVVPNSFFSSQVITNRSRAQWRLFATKLFLPLNMVDKVPDITSKVRAMMEAHPKVFLEQERPHAYLSALTLTSADISLSCNIKPMSKHEYLLASEDILHQVCRIIGEVERDEQTASTSQSP